MIYAFLQGGLTGLMRWVLEPLAILPSGLRDAARFA